jgi:hypothetical protein
MMVHGAMMVPTKGSIGANACSGGSFATEIPDDVIARLDSVQLRNLRGKSHDSGYYYNGSDGGPALTRRTTRSGTPDDWIRESVVNDFKAVTDRKSFMQRMMSSRAQVHDSDSGGCSVDWPSPVSSLGSPPTLPKEVTSAGVAAAASYCSPSGATDYHLCSFPPLPLPPTADGGDDDAPRVFSPRGEDEHAGLPGINSSGETSIQPCGHTAANLKEESLNDSGTTDGPIETRASAAHTPLYASEGLHKEKSIVANLVNEQSASSLGQSENNNKNLLDPLDFGVSKSSVVVSSLESSDSVLNTSYRESFRSALNKTDSARRLVRDLRRASTKRRSNSIFSSISSKGSSMLSASDRSFDSQERSGKYQRDVIQSSLELAVTAPPSDSARSCDAEGNVTKSQIVEGQEPAKTTNQVHELTEEEGEGVLLINLVRMNSQSRPMSSHSNSSRNSLKSRNSFRSRTSFQSRASSLQSTGRDRDHGNISAVSSLASYASPTFNFLSLEASRRSSMPVQTIRNRSAFVDVKRRQSEGIVRRNESDSSLSSLDSLASPIHSTTKKKVGESTNVDAAEEEKLESAIDGLRESPKAELSKADDTDAEDVLRQTPRHRMQRDYTESRRTSVESAIKKDAKESLETILSNADASDADNKPRQNPCNSMGRDFTGSRSLSSMSFDELYSVNSNNSNKKRDFFHSSGLAEDVALHLEHSIHTIKTNFSSDGSDHINPSATGDGRDDFEYAMNSFLDAIKYGHFSELNDNITSCDGNTNDQVLAARAYMGLGFVRQCKGELEGSLDAFTKSLALWQSTLGPNDPVNASISYTIGTVLIEMQRPFDAADYFTKALHLFKCTLDPGPGNRANILSTEGMLFRVLGEVGRAIDCFQKAILVFQTTSQMNTLRFATVSFELGSLLSQRGEYIDSAHCFNVALDIRKALLGDSFVVARTHYSLGVTIASHELKENTTFSSASHLEEALRICEQEFKAEHVQSAIIVHALGVLNERKCDSLSASAWFAKEHTMRKLLFGEGNQALHFIFLLTESMFIVTKITQFFPIISPRPLAR